MKKSAAAALSFFLILTVSCDKKKMTEAVPAQASQNPKDDWHSLEALVGQYPDDVGFFDNTVITPKLKVMLGDRFEILKENMKTCSPISREGVIFVTGNKPHDGGSNSAYLMVDPITQQLEAGLWRDGKFHLFVTSKTPLSKPADIRTMIQNSLETKR